MRTQHNGPMGAMTQADLDREMQQFSFGLPGQMHAGPSSGHAADAFAMEAMQRELAQSAQTNGGPASQGPSESGPLDKKLHVLDMHDKADTSCCGTLLTAWAKEFPQARMTSPPLMQQQSE